MDPNYQNHRQKVEYARASLWAPFYTVGMVARIRGDVPIGPLEAALRKLLTLYPPLASRVCVEEDGTAWLTTEGVDECSLEVRSRTSDDDWTTLFLEQERVPFAFSRGPLARFFLLRGGQVSDLVAIAPHVVCDGYSMTHVMADAVALLNDPGRVVTRPAPPPAVSWQTMPHAVYDNLLLRGLVRVFNRAWRDSRVVLHQDKYEALHRQYWARRQNGLLAFDLSPAETADLAARCRQHGVTVTGALVAAFTLARADVWPATRAARGKISVAVNIRDRLVQPPGRVVGVYASSIDLTIPSKTGTSFWRLARAGYARIHKVLDDRPRILRPLVLEELDPLIADAFVAAVATDQWSRELGLLSRFMNVRGETRCLDISNIGRINLPEVGAPYRLETLLPFPPLVPGGGLALNVLTVDGRMNLILKFRLDGLDGSAVTKIRDRALGYLSGA